MDKGRLQLKVSNPFDFFFQWHLTERCNLRCLHCYQDGKSAVEMTREGIDRTISILSDTISQWSRLYEISFSSAINITGGEPFLHPDFSKILALLHRNNFNLYILTNGTLVGNREAAMLAGIPVKGVQVSLEGPEGIHDKIRGKGSFKKAIRGISHLLSHELTVTMNITLSALNVDCIEDIVSLGLSLGVQRIGFSRLVPSGRGLGLIDSMLSREEVRKAYNMIQSMNISGIDIVTGDPVYSCSIDNTPPEDSEIAFGGCAAGVSGLTILPDGTLLPCRRLNIPIGNILKDDLRSIWANSPVLSGLRNKKKYRGKCSACGLWARCRGCRAIAYQYSLAGGRGDYLAEDPQCFIGESEV